VRYPVFMDTACSSRWLQSRFSAGRGAPLAVDTSRRPGPTVTSPRRRLLDPDYAGCMAVSTVVKLDFELSEDERRAIGALFPSHWLHDPAVAVRAWVQQPPAMRVLLVDAGSIVGHAAVAEATDGLPRGLGIGDVVVAETLRGQGLGRVLLTEVDRACEQTGAEFRFAASRNHAVRRVLRDLGYRTPPFGTLYFQQGDCWNWNETWLAKGDFDPLRPTRLLFDF
jgi:GNAT superfamily N-acetyltransferase